MGVTGKKAVLVPDGNIIAKPVSIKLHSHDLPISGSDNRITLTVVGDIDSPVYIVLTGKRVYILTKGHGNTANTTLERPDTWNFRKQGAL